jgi:thiol-disulfide isomerase/thioredoxin
MLAALLGVLAPASAGEPRPAAASDRTLRSVLERLVLPDVDGQSVPLASYLGSGPLVLDFWATWCKPCLLALPELQSLYDDLGKRGLRVVAINEDGPRNAAKVKPFLQTYGYTFPVLMDLNREAQQLLQAVALPTTIVVDRDGAVLHTSLGFRPGESRKLRAVLEPHLAPAADE